MARTLALQEGVAASAEFSPCRTWRYALWRSWDGDRPALMVVGLNPSTADETLDDPTVRRCQGFARLWGFGSLVMTNAYAFRATDPRDMKAATEPIGPENDRWLAAIASRAGMRLAAWGAHVDPDRERDVLATLDAHGGAKALGVTRAGNPRHPLYMRADTTPIAYPLEAA